MLDQKREELEAELHNIHKRELSSEPHVKKGYKLGNHHFYNPGSAVEALLLCMVVDIMVPTHSVIRSLINPVLVSFKVPYPNPVLVSFKPALSDVALHLTLAENKRKRHVAQCGFERN